MVMQANGVGIGRKHDGAFCFAKRSILFFLFHLLAGFLQPTLASAQCGATIAVFPYHEDFETSQGGWVSGGTGDDWAWGAPNKPTINSAGSGQNCWVTGGLTGSFYNLGERSYVESPCFDFSLLPHPFIQFKIWWESERQYDGASLLYSLDNGSTWKNLGGANDPADCLNDNWFNAASITNLGALANPKHGWAGNIMPTTGSCQGGSGSGGWVTAKHCMPELAAKPTVRFRFVFGAGTACNDFDGVAFDDLNIENAVPISANFNSTCVGNNQYSFADLSTNCPDSWHWDFGDPASGTSNTSASQNPSHTFSGPGLYTVSLQASSDCSGEATISIPIEVAGLAMSSTPTSCFGGYDGTASVQIDSTNSHLSYVWNTVPPQFGPTATHLSAGNYKVSASGTGFCPVLASVTVTEPDSLQAPSFNAIQAFLDTTIALGNPVSLTGIAADPGRIISYKWEPPSYLNCDTCLQTLASPLQTTTYTLIATDTNGCVISDALIINVLPGSVYIPNAFKPSSDDLNDHFTVFADKDVEQVALMQIYDRWGALVFEHQNFPASEAALGWDGSINGKEATAGVYLYLIQVRFLNGVVTLYSGDLTVIR